MTITNPEHKSIGPPARGRSVPGASQACAIAADQIPQMDDLCTISPQERSVSDSLPPRARLPGLPDSATLRRAHNVQESTTAAANRPSPPNRQSTATRSSRNFRRASAAM